MNKLLLSKDLYDKAYIINSIVEFKEHTTIELSENNEYYICLFKNCVYEAQETIHEFENYLIDLTTGSIKK